MSGRKGSLSSENSYQNRKKRSHSPGQIYHSGKDISRSPEHQSYHTTSPKTVRKETRGYRYRMDKDEKYHSGQKYYRTSKESHQYSSKFDDKGELEDVSDFSDYSDNTDDGFLDTHIDKWFSDFDRSEFSSDLEQSSNTKRKRKKKASTGDYDYDDETNTNQVKKTTDKKRVKSSTKAKNIQKAKHKKDHSEKQTDNEMKPKSKRDELHEKVNKLMGESSESTKCKSDHEDVHAKMKKQSISEKHSKKRKKSSDSKSSKSRRNSTEDKAISDSLVAQSNEKGIVPHITGKIKETETPKMRNKRRHLSPTTSATAKRRRTRSWSRERSRSPSRSRSRSRSRSSSGLGQPQPRSHILDELYQLILAPTSG